MKSRRFWGLTAAIVACGVLPFASSGLVPANPASASTPAPSETPEYVTQLEREIAELEAQIGAVREPTGDVVGPGTIQPYLHYGTDGDIDVDVDVDVMMMTEEDLLQQETLFALQDAGLNSMSPEISGMYTLSQVQPGRMMVYYDEKSPKLPALTAIVEQARSAAPLPIEMEPNGVNPGSLEELGKRLMDGEAEKYGITSVVRSFQFNPLTGTVAMGVVGQAAFDAYVAKNGIPELTVDGVLIELFVVSEDDGTGPQSRSDQ